MGNNPDRTKLYWCNWPSHVGGADTKFVHLLPLLAEEYDITVVPNDPASLDKPGWPEWLEMTGVRTCSMAQLPERLEGWAVSLCNKQFFGNGLAREMKRRGARIAWSNEMMWHFEGELEALHNGLVDRIMYVSAGQRAVLEPQYREAVTAPAGDQEPDAHWGEIPRPGQAALPWVMTGNWIDPAVFPCRRRGEDGAGPLTIGRLSRPDPDKFPDNFPASYEALGLRNPVRFRVMGWSDKLTERWSEHVFDARWELLAPAVEPVASFLDSLDLFVYDLSPRFSESWGRAVVEAMLCGVVPIVPADGRHHLHRLVQHGVSGFLCQEQADFGKYARLLQGDAALRQRLSAAAREDACTRHCHADTHRQLWKRVFD